MNSDIYLLILVLFVSLWYLYNNKITNIKDACALKISMKIADLNYCQKELEEQIRQNEDLRNKIKSNQEKIDTLQYKLLRTERINNQSIITDEELQYFAKMIRMCDKNAIKVYKEYGGKIYIGSADVIENGKKLHKTNGHLWNVIKYKKNMQEQLVDIINFKSNEEVSYANHKGRLIPPAEVGTPKMHDYL